MAKAANSDGKLVKEWMQGNTKVRVFDGAYAGKTPEQLHEVDKRIAKACWAIVNAARAAGKDI